MFKQGNEVVRKDTTAEHGTQGIPAGTLGIVKCVTNVETFVEWQNEKVVQSYANESVSQFVELAVKQINLPQSNWKFDDTVAPVFDEHVRQSVPMYDEMQRLVADYSTWFVENGTNVYDIGTSTGETLFNLLKLNEYKEAQFIGIDDSRHMLEKATNRLFDSGAVLMQEDITRFSFINASFIASVLTLQFIHPSERQELVNKLFNGLNKGGAFVMVEKIIGDNPRFNEMFIEQYHEMKLRNGLSVQHIWDKQKAIRGVMRPYTISENMRMLHEAGFTDIDLFFKWNNFAGFIAIK